MNVLRHVVFVTLLALATTVIADDSYDDLASSIEEKNFTSAEKKHFIDATRKFFKYEISDSFISRSTTAWLDNDHIVFSARQLPGWKARFDEPSRIVSFNVTTGKYSDSGYKGKQVCMSHLGEMLVRLGGNENLTRNNPEEYQWLFGKWGSELTYLQWEYASFVPNYLCRFRAFRTEIESLHSDDQKRHFYRDTPLLPEHGLIREAVIRNGNSESSSVYLIAPDNQSKYLGINAPSRSFLNFFPWLNAYFETASITKGPKTWHPSGEITNYPPPRLLAFWHSTSTTTSISGTLTKKGMLWDVHMQKDFWRKQGLYLETKEGLLRIEEGQGISPIVSPDGCRIIDSVVRGDLYKTFRQLDTWLVIDLCKEK